MTTYQDINLINTNFVELSPKGVEERIWMLQKELADRLEDVAYGTDLYYYATQILENVCRAALACRDEKPDPWTVSTILLTGILTYTGPGADKFSDPIYLLSHELTGTPEECTCNGDQTCPSCREAANKAYASFENFTYIDLR